MLVIGAGMAGLTAALSALERGASVVLLSRFPATRSPSSAFKGGFNAAEGSAEVEIHVADALAHGGPGTSEAMARSRAQAAGGLAEWLARQGLPFDRDGAGFLRQSLPGSSRPRTLSAGAAFGRQLIHALDGQVRRFERAGRLERADGWHLAELILDDEGRCRGAVAVHLHTLEARAFSADAVVLAAGGAGWLVKPTACALDCDGAAVGLAHRHGARLQDADRLAWHPSVPGPDKDLAVPPLLLVQGAKATEDTLDLRGLGKPAWKRWGGSFPRLAAAFSGKNPAGELLPLRSAVVGSLGGLRVDEDMATDLPGLLAAGEAASGGFGARALPGDEALAWLHQAQVAGRSAAGAKVREAEPAEALRAQEATVLRLRAVHAAHGSTSPGGLLAELSQELTLALGPGGSLEAVNALEGLAARVESDLWVKDRSLVANAGTLAALDLPASLAWARSVVATAAARRTAPPDVVLNAAWTGAGPRIAAEGVGA
ncbi:MAG: FAD-binding protein [Holophagaceae bacterium]|nr:FAD-binding protein [Holophagaceae bacterium]